MLRSALVLFGFLLMAGTATAQECGEPPSRISDGAYWSYLEACGCAKVSPPSRIASDYQRFLKACKDWRERNRPIVVVTSSSKPAAAGASPSPVTASVVNQAAQSPECAEVPTRISQHYWEYLESCGCDKAEPPSQISPDSSRFLKVCSTWRERNQPPVVVVPEARAPSPSPSPSPSPN